MYAVRGALDTALCTRTCFEENKMSNSWSDREFGTTRRTDRGSGYEKKTGHDDVTRVSFYLISKRTRPDLTYNHNEK